MDVRPEKPHVLIVDDHAIIRRGLREALRQHWPDCQVDEATTIAGILPALERARCDLMLLDLHMGDRNAIDVLEDICQRHPRVKVLVFSMSSERVFAQRALSKGAHGFVSKGADERDLIAAMERVLAGGIHIDPSSRVHQRPKHPHRDDVTDPDPFAELSEREARVMHELLTGAGVKVIAARLALQPSTVATYKARLFDKLGVSNIIDLQTLVVMHNKAKGA